MGRRIFKKATSAWCAFFLVLTLGGCARQEEESAPTADTEVSGANKGNAAEEEHEVDGRMNQEHANAETPPTAPNPGAEAFPWPPPKPTSRALLSRSLFANHNATLGNVADWLLTALEPLGYSEHSFYSIPGGFALVTRLEQIDADGKPLAEPMRWSAGYPPRPTFTLMDCVRALFTAPEGNYRVLVFFATDQAIGGSLRSATRDEANIWLARGTDRLPPSIAHIRFRPDGDVTAYVYQFRKVGQIREPISNPDGAPPAENQLVKTGILAALGKR